MTNTPKTDNHSSADAQRPAPHPETEADKKGGVDSAKRQAERDWDDSAKESGE